MKLMIDGVASEPFSAETLPPLSGLTNNKDKIIKVSRERYSQPRQVVEDKIIRWTGIEEMYKAAAEEENFESKNKPPIFNEAKKMPNNFGEYHRQTDFAQKKSKPLIPFEKLESIPLSETQNEISLQEALTRKPQTFKVRPPSHDHKPASFLPESSKKQFFDPGNSHKLKPGQVARLN
jgi:hypothetical protein